jgi:hypothetical protein
MKTAMSDNAARYLFLSGEKPFYAFVSSFACENTGDGLIAPYLITFTEESAK